MNFKNQVLGLAAISLLALTACKKDIVTEQQDVNMDAIASDATANDVIETAAPLTKAITTSSIISNSGGYYEVLPARYSLTTKSYPLILFIHGIGELGTGVSRLTCCGLPYYANKKQFPADFVVNGQHFSFIVVAPQFKVRPSAADMQNYISWATKHYRVDPSRIYIAGLSMGGGSTWDYSAVYGQNVAAAVPVCGGTAPTQALAKSVASKNLPIWTISSKSDAVVPISWAQNWVSWIKADNPSNAGNVKITVYTSGENHNTTWAKAFNPATYMDGLNIYQWMLKYKRTSSGSASAPPVTTPTTPSTPSTGTVVANAGADETIHLFWKYSPLLNATLSKAPGTWFVSALWSKVSGPAGDKIVNYSAFNTRVSFTATGTYVYKVTLKTKTGVTVTDTKTITVLK